MENLVADKAKKRAHAHKQENWAISVCVENAVCLYIELVFRAKNSASNFIFDRIRFFQLFDERKFYQWSCIYILANTGPEVETRWRGWRRG